MGLRTKLGLKKNKTRFNPKSPVPFLPRPVAIWLLLHGLWPRRRLRTRYTVIAACYNVEAYIDDFFTSLFSQTVDPECLEIITVDDGSTDGTAARIKWWYERYPCRIRYVHQPNQGQAVARNTGLELATGEWVSFMDPDDFVSPDYLECADAEAQLKADCPLSMISCRMILFHENTGKFDNTHPLNYRFVKRRTAHLLPDLGEHVQLSSNSIWLRRELIAKAGLRFDPRVAPTFEDGHFVNRYLLYNRDTRAVFLRKPTYYYRKRARKDSTLDGSITKKSWYIDQLRHGYLALLAEAGTAYGLVPRFLQRTVLYDIFWRFRHLVDHPERAAFLSCEEQDEFLNLLYRIFDYIEIPTIDSFNLAGCHEEHKVGLLSLMKQARRPVGHVCVRQYDEAKRLVQFSYCSGDTELNVSVRVNDRAVPVRFPSQRRTTFLSRIYFVEHFFWIRMEPGDYVTVRVGGQIAAIKKGARHLGCMPALSGLVGALRPTPPAKKARGLRKAATSPDVRRKYGDCWLLMDRDKKADDNAEHLYRYLLSIGQAEKAYFVLRPTSPDWSRLKSEGFKLIAYGSREHHVALVNAKYLISSHADEYIFRPPGYRRVEGLEQYKFVFLQHGVTKDDLSLWLNGKQLDRIITSTQAEYISISAQTSNYKFSEREAVLNGFPRHDSLMAAKRTSRYILIMPTWRKYLLGRMTGRELIWEGTPGLRHSEYATRWRSLLNSDRLKQLAERAGLRVVFAPHPNLSPHTEIFDLPPHVRLLDPMQTSSLQPIFTDTAVLITDFSSVAFDVAYLEKPVLYYQFDAEKIFSGMHPYRRGYFDYELDGFGPVCSTEDDLLNELERTLGGRENKDFAARRRNTFPFRDGRCCERVYKSILELEAPPAADPTVPLKSYTAVPNAGDAASAVVISRLIASSVRVVGRNFAEGPHLLGLGSILHWSNRHSVVWGSGFLSEDLSPVEMPDRVFAVRGPVSRQRLLAMGCACPQLYGDPGILISDLFPSRIHQPNRLGVIPHYVDREHPFVETAEHSGALVIDPGLPLGEYLALLQQCECVISSSLHGIIFAHSYGIPAVWVRLSDNVIGNGYKFRDYYESIGFKPGDIRSGSDESSLDELVRAAAVPKEDIDRAALRSALEQAQQYIWDRIASSRSEFGGESFEAQRPVPGASRGVYQVRASV